ncbi:hypothetical protein VTP01DRAFT_6401 [Rhizomucor pusillus]|uniref:uncharacterized protein n=1 Tax=Rhizomucor pusillus TaxID=4840 RepID=UPI003744AFB2
MAYTKRILKELRDVEEDKHAKIKIRPNQSLDHFHATIHGPPDTPYENGIFLLEIKLPNGYPFDPPHVKFVSKVYHPNISSQTGAICIDILRKTWSPMMTLKLVLQSIQIMLGSPVPDDPQDAQVASHYLENKTDFDKTARYWTEVYAHGDAQLAEMSDEN